MKRVFEKISDKRLLFLLLVEAAVLLCMIYLAVSRPVQKQAVSFADFGVSQSENLSYDGETITMRGDMPQSILAWGHRLRSGAYEVNVRYDGGQDGKYTDILGNVEFESMWPVKYSAVNLRAGHISAQGRLWVPLGARSDDLSVVVKYHGKAPLELISIEMAEQPAYRFMRILAAALLFALINALYLLLLSPVKKPGKKSMTLFALSLLAFIASIPFFADFVFYGHDIAYHLQRIVMLAEEIKYGQLPARIYTTANNGMGYAAPIFYGDLFLYVPALLYNCMVPLYVCYQVYAIMMNVLTSFISYYCFRRVTGEKLLAMLGAALYTLCSFRLISLTVRAAVGEYSAMTFLPLVLLGMHEIYCKEKPDFGDWAPLALGMAGVCLSHVLTTELMAIDLMLLCLLLYKQIFKRARIIAIIKAAGLCILLCAWFVIPFLESYMMQEFTIKRSYYSLQDRGIYLIQLLGIFMPGSGVTNHIDGMQGAMPLTIGFSLVLGIAVIVICLLNRHTWRLHREESYLVWRASFLCAVINLAMALRYFPWRVIQLRLGIDSGDLGQILSSMQFPWRWLTPASAFLALGTVLALQTLKKHRMALYRISCGMLIGALTISTGYLYYRYSNEANQMRVYGSENTDYLDELYLLIGTDQNAYMQKKVAVVQGTAQVIDYKKMCATSYLSVDNNAQEMAYVQIPVFSYRHYKAENDQGKAVSIVSGENNCIALEIAPGYHGTIKIRFAPPVYWRMAEAVSLLSLLGVAAAYLMRARRNFSRGELKKS